MKKFLPIVVSSVALGLATAANAAITAPTLNTTDTETIAIAVVAGFAIIWGLKRAIGLIRS